MATEDTPPQELQNTLDGYEIGRAFDRSCPSCGQEYTVGDRLVVRAEREGTAWTDLSIVCVDCSDRSLSTDSGFDVDRALVEVDLVATPVTLVLDGDSAEMIDYAVAREE